MRGALLKCSLSHGVCVVNVSDWSLTVTAGGRGPRCAMLVGIVVCYTLLCIVGGIMGVLSLYVV